MCLAIPTRIVSLDEQDPSFATVEAGGVRRAINIGLLERGSVTVGDWVLVHVGFALSKVDEERAQEQLRLLRALGEELLALDEVRGYAT